MSDVTQRTGIGVTWVSEDTSKRYSLCCTINDQFCLVLLAGMPSNHSPDFMTPATPTSLGHLTQSPPSSPGAQNSEAAATRTLLADDVMIPTSPSTASYRMLMKNLQNLQVGS